MRLDFRFFRKQSKNIQFCHTHRPVIAGYVCVCGVGGGGVQELVIYIIKTGKAAL